MVTTSILPVQEKEAELVYEIKACPSTCLNRYASIIHYGASKKAITGSMTHVEFQERMA